MKKFILLCAATAALTFPACKKKAPANNPANNNEQLIVGKWQPKKAFFLDAGGRELRAEEGNNDCPTPDSWAFSADKTFTIIDYTKSTSNNTNCIKSEQKGTWEIAGNTLSITFSFTTNDATVTTTTRSELTTLTDNILEITRAVQNIQREEREENTDTDANIAKVRLYFEKAQ